MKHDLQGIFDALLEGVIVLDPVGDVDFLNGEAARILGISSEQPPDTRLERLLGRNHPVCRIVERVQATGRASIHDEVEISRRQEPPLPVDVSVSPIREEEGGSSGIVVAMRDRTAARSLREEVSERERQESYGHIAAGIAHEVKNPLGGIRGAAELLASNVQDERSQKHARLIVGEVDRISNLVDELMVFARGDGLELEPVNVHRLLDSLLDLLELERGYQEIRIERHFDPSLPEIQADPARLQQVFLNLARNALQAMEKTGGTLTLTTRMTLEHRLVGRDGRPRPTIEISFADCGPGIPQSLHHRLATPFFTTRRQGTGLGLSVSRHWIRRHGGRLRIESSEGEGTRVHVDLPLSPTETPHAPNALPESASSENGPPDCVGPEEI